MSRRSSNGAGNALERATAALDETKARLAALAIERDKVLLDGSDDEAVARVDDEIEARNRLLRTHVDRVRLLAVEAERAENERRVREKKQLIARVEKVFVDRDAAAAELQKHLIAAEKAFREIDRLNHVVRAAWPFTAGDLPAIVATGGALFMATQHFLYKIGARPELLGGQVTPGGSLSFPGGKCPRIEDTYQPHKLPALADVFHDGSVHAGNIMRGRRDIAVPPHIAAAAEAASASLGTSPGNGAAVADNGHIPPGNGHAAHAPLERTEQQIELSRLLVRQNELAMLDTPEAETEYALNGAAIAALSA